MINRRAVSRFAWLVVGSVACAATGTSAELPLSASNAISVSGSGSSSGPVVNLGYATYEGYYNGTFDLNIWKSIRYAAPPTGHRRWQAPELPLHENRSVIPAVTQPPICPQSGAFGTPAVYGFNSGLGNEDCLYLNVYAAPNATKLPVLVWIHGGGHSVFGASYDPSVWMNTNNNGFITVEMQYRLGAFGFLASPDVKQHGKLNTGLLDQRFAIEWTRRNIAKFGGDPDRITIGGESSGASSVVFHSLAYGGNDTKLFNNLIVASPYFPSIYKYSDPVPKARYDKFVELAGCGDSSITPGPHKTTFDCLVAADSEVLQNASGTVSTTLGYFGSFGFTPVIDDDYIRERPTAQLLNGRLNGQRALIGNNGNEGSPLVNPNVSTRAQYDAFVVETFPLFTPKDVSQLSEVYQIPEQTSPDDASGPVFDTLGYTGPTALTQSGISTGIQQSVFNLAAETVFDCPAQWIAEAFSSTSKSCEKRTAWRYQYSVTPSYHGADLRAYFAVGGTASSAPGADLRHAMQRMFGSFIIEDTPVIPLVDAMGSHAENASVPTLAGSENIHWPSYTAADPALMNLNTTGGEVRLVVVAPTLSYYLRTGADVVNNFSLADAHAWEGGRGDRCAFWRTVAARVPQ